MCVTGVKPKLDMCLRNTDAPDNNKVKIFKSKIMNPPPGAIDVNEVWEAASNTY